MELGTLFLEIGQSRPRETIPFVICAELLGDMILLSHISHFF